MIWNAETIVALINAGVVLIPKFMEMYDEISATFSTDDKAAVDAALAKARARDAADTTKADKDLDDAAGRT